MCGGGRIREGLRKWRRTEFMSCVQVVEVERVHILSYLRRSLRGGADSE